MNAIKLREDLRALAATILQIVQYEVTEADVDVALKENQRLATLLYAELYQGKLDAKAEQRVYQSLMAEANKPIHDCCSPCSDLNCNWLHHAPEEFKPVTLSAEDKEMIDGQIRNASQIKAALGLPGISPLQHAMADIVKTHLLPPDKLSSPEKRRALKMRLLIAVTKTYEYQVDDAWREDVPALKDLIRRCHDQAPISELVRNKIPDHRHQFIECCLSELELTTEPEG